MARESILKPSRGSPFRSLFRLPAPCDTECMARPDLYDYIGLAVAALVVALWVAHFVAPTPPPAVP